MSSSAPRLLAWARALEHFAGLVLADTVSATIKGARLWLGDQLGFVRAMVQELIFAPASSDKVNIFYGYELDDLVDIYRAVAGTALRTQIWLGGTVGEYIVNSVLSQLAGIALGETLADYARLILNVYRGIRPTWAFNLIFMGNLFEYIAEDSLALIMAMGGEHVLGTISYLQQALGWLFELEQMDVIRALDRAVDDFEDAITWDIDVAMRETRWWFSEGLRVYHRAFTRLLSIVDRIIERAMARLWELRLQTLTVRKWFELGVVDVKRVLRLMGQVEAEVDMTIQNVNDAIKFVYDALGVMNFEPELDALEATVDRVYMILAENALRKLGAVGRANYDELMNKLVRSVKKLVAYRTRVAPGYSRGVAGPLIEPVYPQPMSSITIVDVYGADG